MWGGHVTECGRSRTRSATRLGARYFWGQEGMGGGLSDPPPSAGFVEV